MGERRERHRRYRAASWEEREREREEREKGEKAGGILPFKRGGAAHVHRAHTAGQVCLNANSEDLTKLFKVCEE